VLSKTVSSCLSSKLRTREMSETQGIQLYTEILFYHVLKFYSNNIRIAGICMIVFL